MKTFTFEKRSALPVDRQAAFAWHDRPGAFERLTPPFEPVTLVEHTGGIRDGARVVIRIKNGPIAIHWHAHHEGYDPPSMFVDVQEKGPFAYWRHEHRFEAGDAGHAVMHDHVTFAPPLGPLGRLGLPVIRKKLERMFAYRHDTLAHDLADHARFADQGPRTFVVTGASGLVGTQLCAFLSTGGHKVRRMVRTNADTGAGRYLWDPLTGDFDPSALDGADAVIHLAGESVFALRWSASKKRSILESRERGTRTVADAIRAHGGVSTLISASAVGYYGDVPQGDVDERAPKGEGFLADVCEAWEAPARELNRDGVRVVTARIGVVLSPAGGALATMRTPFALGLGGPIGSGRQGFPWVSIDDTVRALHWCAMRSDLSGPVNLVAPETITQRAFASALGRVLRRPAVLPAPAPMLKLLAGELAREVFLKGAAVVPRTLLDSGFVFRDDRASSALARLLGRASR
ncbi:MAG: TIGR01777 family oxidoreductase [Phycisphaerales bacterium]